jgi:hypothetical protein
MPDPVEVAKREKEREQIYRREQPTKPMSPSERYALLARFQSNHRFALADPNGRGTIDMVMRPPEPRYRK